MIAAVENVVRARVGDLVKGIEIFQQAAHGTPHVVVLGDGETARLGGQQLERRGALVRGHARGQQRNGRIVSGGGLIALTLAPRTGLTRRTQYLLVNDAPGGVRGDAGGGPHDGALDLGGFAGGGLDSRGRHFPGGRFDARPRGFAVRRGGPKQQQLPINHPNGEAHVRPGEGEEHRGGLPGEPGRLAAHAVEDQGQPHRPAVLGIDELRGEHGARLSRPRPPKNRVLPGCGRCGPWRRAPPPSGASREARRRAENSRFGQRP